MLVKINNRILLPLPELLMATVQAVVSRSFLVMPASYNRLYYNKQSSSLILVSFGEPETVGLIDDCSEAFQLSRKQTIAVIMSTEQKPTFEWARSVKNMARIEYFNYIDAIKHLRQDSITDVQYLYAQIDKGL